MKKACTKILIMLVLVLTLSTVLPAQMSVFLPENISVAEAASKVKINKTKATLFKGKTVQLKISGTKKKVKWTTSDKKVATVSSKGKVTGKGAGKATITAKVNNKKYTCKVTVQDPKLSETNLTLKVDDSKTLKLTGVTGKVTWTSSNKRVATVSSKGKVTGKQAGKATITAKISGKKYKCTVTVKTEKPKFEYSASVTEVELDEGASQKIIVTAVDTGTIFGKTENSSIATCEWDEDWNGNEIGLTIKAKKAGSTIINLTNSKNLQPIKIPVVVIAPKFEVETSELTLKEGSKEGISITYAGDGTISYKTADSSIVSCEWTKQWSNNTTTLNINGKATGSTTVTITNSINDEELVINVTVLSPVTIKLPTLPKSLYDYTYSGRIDEGCVVNDIKYEISKSGSRYFYKIYFTGEKTYDSDGDNMSSSCSIGYKIYKDGMVVESGTAYTVDVCVGEKFGGSANYTNGYLDEPGEYELVLLDTQ